LKRPRILLADDHTLVIQGLEELLTGDFDVVGKVENGYAALDAVRILKPDVVLLDISMPQLNGIDAARQLQRTARGTKIIFLTMHADPAYVTEAFRAGASGYLLKRSAASELVTAIREVLAGRFYVTPLVARDVLEPLGKKARKAKGFSIAALTPRQRQVYAGPFRDRAAKSYSYARVREPGMRSPRAVWRRFKSSKPGAFLAGDERERAKPFILQSVTPMTYRPAGAPRTCRRPD
jgi:DNA-binding NarL/FixJ family response regulator